MTVTDAGRKASGEPRVCGTREESSILSRPSTLEPAPARLIRVRCLAPKCQWVGWLDRQTGHLVNQAPRGPWAITPCPRCGGVYAAYA